MSDFNTDSRGKIWKIETMSPTRAREVERKVGAILDTLRNSGESPQQAHLILLVAISSLEKEYDLEPPIVLPPGSEMKQ